MDFDIEFNADELTDIEINKACDLADSKYSTNAWNFNK